MEKLLNDFSALTSLWILELLYRNIVYQNCSDPSAPLNKMSASAKNRKTDKRALLHNQWMDFDIITHACSLDDPLLKLLKPFRCVEQNDRQGYK